MIVHSIAVPGRPSATCRLACLAAALAAGLSGAAPAFAKPSRGNAPAQSGPSIDVTNCSDDGAPGSLRYEVINAPSGSTIDLSALACSTITLDGNWPIPELQVMQPSLYLKGPADHHLTIDGGAHSRVFHHFGAGTLGLTDLNIVNGYYARTDASGGCIYSAHDVVLTRSTVSDCTLGSVSTAARGGAVYAAGDLDLNGSAIVRSRAVGTGQSGAAGGGAFVRGDFSMSYSTLSDNAASAKYGSAHSVSGGAIALGNVTIQGSTISGNQADIVAGLGMSGGYNYGFSAIIVNSTIADNVAADRFGGAWANIPLELFNSTIAFNHAKAAGGLPGAGLYSDFLVTLQSSIIADNASDSGPSDLGIVGIGALDGASSNNLIIASNVPLPVGTIRDCPKLQPLADNGGPTRTLLPSSTSPALDNGNDILGLLSDQRLATRVVNGFADIGSVERQSGEIDDRILAEGFDGLCDQ